MKTVAGSLILALLLPGPLFGQVPQEAPRVTGSVELTLHNLDLVVVDAHGSPVHGLAATDFEVRHDGKPVRITNFHEEVPAPVPVPTPIPVPLESSAPAPVRPAAESPAASASPAPQQAASPQAPAAQRHVVLFIDRLSLPDPKERAEFYVSLKELLRRSLASGGEAMIVVWNRSVRTVHPFSSNLPSLYSAIDAASGLAKNLAAEQDELDRLAVNDTWFQQMGAGDSTLSRQIDAQQDYLEIRGKASAIRGLCSMMSGMDGRKAVVIAARRLSRMAGQEYGGGAAINTRDLMDQVSASANAAGVTLHTIYSASTEFDTPNASASRYGIPAFNGPRSTGSMQANWNNEMATLGTLAEKTGGVVIGNIAEATVFAERVSQDLLSWYSIGYPVPDGARKSADVSVRVTRPGLTVRVRRSIVEKPPEEAMKDRVLANMFRRDANARLPIAVSLKSQKASGSTVVRHFEIRIPLDRLLLRPGAKSRKGAVSLFAVSAGPGGDFSEVNRVRKEIELPPAQPGAAGPGHVTFEIDVESKKSAARISLGVWDELGQDAGFRVATFQ